MNRGVLVFGVAAAVIFTVAKKSTAAKNLYFKQIRFKKLHWKVLNGTIELVMPIVNPTRGSLSLDGFNGVLTYKGKTLGSLLINERIKIKAGQMTEIPVSVDVSAVSVGVQVFDLFKKFAAAKNDPKNAGKNYWLDGVYVEGNLISNGLQIPVKSKVF